MWFFLNAIHAFNDFNLLNEPVKQFCFKIYLAIFLCYFYGIIMKKWIQFLKRKALRNIINKNI